MKILVIGGTGTVGSQVVNVLLSRKADVRVMTSSKEKAAQLSAGVEGIVANLRDASTLGPAFSGVDRVFLITPISETETQEGVNGVNAAKAAGVTRIVYMSVFRLEDIPNAPHFYAKKPVEDAVKGSGIPYTVIRPNHFYQNDNFFKQPIMEFGIYPQPLGAKGVSSVDVRDIADAAVNALMNDGYTGKTISVAGPDLRTGEANARILSKHLGREIVYAGDDLNSFSEQASKMMPGWMVEDFRIMFHHFQTKGFVATPDHLAETERILGRKPRTYEAFASELAKTWKQETTEGAKAKTTS